MSARRHLAHWLLSNLFTLITIRAHRLARKDWPRTSLPRVISVQDQIESARVNMRSAKWQEFVEQTNEAHTVH